MIDESKNPYESSACSLSKRLEDADTFTDLLIENNYQAWRTTCQVVSNAAVYGKVLHRLPVDIEHPPCFPNTDILDAFSSK